MDGQVTAHEGPHPSKGTYIKVAVVLFILTAIEVGVYYVDILHTTGLIVPILLGLSALKFSLVAMFYMHLKPDSRLYSGLFLFPLTIAAVIIVSLVLLFAYRGRLL